MASLMQPCCKASYFLVIQDIKKVFFTVCIKCVITGNDNWLKLYSDTYIDLERITHIHLGPTKFMQFVGGNQNEGINYALL